MGFYGECTPCSARCREQTRPVCFCSLSSSKRSRMSVIIDIILFLRRYVAQMQLAHAVNP